MNTNKETLLDSKVNIRILLSAMWTGVMFCYIYGDYFDLYVPGTVDGLMNGQNNLDSPGKLFLATFLLTLPALMIFLTITLKPAVAKWLNVAIGIFFTLFTLLVGLTSMSTWRTFYVFLSFLESILTTIIVYQALRWPKVVLPSRSNDGSI